MSFFSKILLNNYYLYGHDKKYCVIFFELLSGQFKIRVFLLCSLAYLQLVELVL